MFLDQVCHLLFQSKYPINKFILRSGCSNHNVDVHLTCRPLECTKGPNSWNKFVWCSKLKNNFFPVNFCDGKVGLNPKF